MKARDLGAGWNFCQAIWSGVAGFAETCGVSLDSTFRETHTTVVAKVWRTFQRLIPQLGPVISWKKRDTFSPPGGAQALFRWTQNCIPKNFWGKLKDEQEQIHEIYPIYTRGGQTLNMRHLELLKRHVSSREQKKRKKSEVRLAYLHLEPYLGQIFVARMLKRCSGTVKCKRFRLCTGGIWPFAPLPSTLTKSRLQNFGWRRLPFSWYQ